MYQSFLKVISIFLINKIIPLFYLLYKTNISFLLKKICINYNNILINKYCFLIYKKNDFLNKQKYFVNKSKINFNVSLKKKIKINIRSLLKFKYKISFYFKKINYFLLKRKYKLSKNFILKNIKKGLIKKHKIFFYKKYINLFYIKKKKLHLYKNKYIKKRHRLRALTKDVKYAMYTIKKFLTLLTNSKIYLILINSLSFCKFFYYTHKKILIKHYQNERFNLWPIQRYFFNRYKYTAIYIKDFIYLGFISTLTKNPQILVNMISKQFEFLPKNRRQFKLWNFITQTLGALCAKRLEIYGYKLSINGRLNKARRTQTYVFKKGALPLQSTRTRVEYAYSEGLTRKGLIGIKLWFLYHKWFKFKLRAKVLEYFLYSKYKNSFNFTIYKQNYKYLQKKKEIARIGHRKYYEKINAKTADEEIDEKIALFRSLSDKRNKMPFNKNKNVETKTT